MLSFSEKRNRERREAKKLGTCGYDNALKFMREVVDSEVVAPNRAKRVKYFLFMLLHVLAHTSISFKTKFTFHLIFLEYYIPLCKAVPAI